MQDQLFDFLVGKDIRRSAIALAAENIIRWDFMTRVSSSRKARAARSPWAGSPPLATSASWTSFAILSI